MIYGDVLLVAYACTTGMGVIHIDKMVFNRPGLRFDAKSKKSSWTRCVLYCYQEQRYRYPFVD